MAKAFRTLARLPRSSKIRLVARDTVEEKILDLQAGKRALADAVIQADQSVMAHLTREDLELLLS